MTNPALAFISSFSKQEDDQFFDIVYDGRVVVCHVKKAEGETLARQMGEGYTLKPNDGTVPNTVRR